MAARSQEPVGREPGGEPDGRPAPAPPTDYRPASVRRGRPTRPLGRTGGQQGGAPPWRGSPPAALPKPALDLAWLGRTSTYDRQDPTLSLPRQLANAQDALPDNARIVAHFYDIESGRLELTARGRGTAHEQLAIPVPRDGGIQDLLAEARRPGRRFDAVICESIDRIARRTYSGTHIEHELEQAGVLLLAADEPIPLARKRATQILTRRVKQGVAEWYVLELLEKAEDGYVVHTQQGWNIGRPPYGYLGEQVPHPVPAKRAEGKTKTRLVPDPVRAPVVEQIYRWRVDERLGYAAIAERLNRDLDRYPPPQSPDPARRRDCWSRSAVYELLRNPKYTGYQVWNRRATKQGGRVNPPQAWVWSPKPTHPPIVPVELFEAAAEVGAQRQGSRHGAGRNPHPQTRRVYLLRGLVVCVLCGRRLFGKTRKGLAYFACQPDRSVGRLAADRHPGHPHTVWIGQAALLDGILAFFTERLFGAARHRLLAADLTALQPAAEADWQARVDALERTLADLERRQRRLLAPLETCDDPTGVVFEQIRARAEELAAIAAAKQTELTGLLARRPTAAEQAPELLGRLPLLAEADLRDVPEPLLRRLFEAFQLQVRYDRAANLATVRVTLTDGALDGLELPDTLRPDGDSTATGEKTTGAADIVAAPGSHVVGALGRARTTWEPSTATTRQLQLI